MNLKEVNLGVEPAEHTHHLSQNEVPMFVPAIPICLSWMDTVSVVGGANHNSCDRFPVKDAGHGS